MSIQIYKIYPRLFGANSYILTKDGQNAVVVDPSGTGVLDELNKRNLVPAYVLLTHSHFDHIGGVPVLTARGVKVVCAKKEIPAFGTTAELGEKYGYSKFDLTADITLVDGEKINLAGIDFTVLETPGHTAGSVCYLVEEEKVMFVGDTLFEGSVGRTDLPTGSSSKMRESLRKLKNLTGDYTLYCGHGEDTSLNIERVTNPFLIDA